MYLNGFLFGISYLDEVGNLDESMGFISWKTACFYIF